MKVFSKFLCMLLVVAMVTTTPVFAAEEVASLAEAADSRSSGYFCCSSVYLYQKYSTSTTFEAWFDVGAVGIMDELGASEVRIQRSSDGENWTTMWTYTKEAYPGMIYANTSGHAYGLSYTGTVGYYYRAFVILYAKKGNSYAEMYEYTATLKL